MIKKISHEKYNLLHKAGSACEIIARCSELYIAWVLKTPKGWREHSLSSKLLHCLTVLMGLKLFIISSMNLYYFSLCLLPFHYAQSFFHLLHYLPIGLDRILLDPPVFFLSPERTSPAHVLLTLLLALY